MDFHRYRALTGSRLKFWTVPQGLKIHRTLTVLWNPELLLEAVWTVALWTQDPHRASSAKLGDAMQGLVIPKSRILDPEPGGGVLHTLSLTAPESGNRILDSGSCLIRQDCVCFSAGSGSKIQNPWAPHGVQRHMAWKPLSLASKSSKSNRDPRS